MKKSLRNDHFILSFVYFLFYIGIMLLFCINYKDDYIMYKLYMHNFGWLYFHQGEFKYQNGIFLDFFVVGMMILLFHIKPELLNISFKKLFIEKIKRMKRTEKNVGKKVD